VIPVTSKVTLYDIVSKSHLQHPKTKDNMAYFLDSEVKRAIESELKDSMKDE